MTPGSPARPRSRCSRSASQAPPDQMPTSARLGLHQRAHAGEQLGVERFGVEGQRLMRAPSGARRARQVLVEDDRGGGRVEVARARAALRLGRGVALVDLVHRQAEARLAAARERRARGGVDVRRAVGMARDADDQRVGLPFGDQRADRVEPRPSPCDAMRAAAARGPRQGVAGGDADAPGAEIESEKGERRTGTEDARARPHACPASWLSMPGRCRAATAPCRSAARPACRR